METEERLQRTNYETDKAFFEAVLKQEFAWARKQRRDLPYNDGEGFVPRITMIGPHFQIARIPAEWSNMDEKYEFMSKLGVSAKVLGYRAILLSSDTRMVQSDDFIEHFKLRPIDPTIEGDGERFRNEYHTIMKSVRDFKKLPRHLWTEAIITAMKTPNDVTVRAAHYMRHGNSIAWLPDRSDRFDAGAELNLIPDWWNIPDDDPNVAEAKRLTTEFFEKD